MRGADPILFPDVTADLALAVDGFDLRITAARRRVVVDLPSLRAGSALVRSLPGGLTRLAALRRLVRRYGLTVVVRVGGYPLARFGRFLSPRKAAPLA